MDQNQCKKRQSPNWNRRQCTVTSVTQLSAFIDCHYVSQLTFYYTIPSIGALMVSKLYYSNAI